MPIRINLLAEKQWEEELRRRDPVKKAIMIAGMVVAAMVLWVVLLMVEMGSKHSDLVALQKKYTGKTNDFMQATNQLKGNQNLDGRVRSLDKYATNRFLWANALDALQYMTVTNIKFTKLLTQQSFTTNAVLTLQSNLVIEITPPRKWYQFGKGDAGAGVQVAAAATNFMTQLASLTRFKTNSSIVLKTYNLKTNEDRTQVTVAATITRVLATQESRTLVISGKDFSPTAGQQIYALTNALLTSPYFGKYLTVTNLAIDTSFQLERDPFAQGEGDYVRSTFTAIFQTW